ncbi:MAG: helix-turn-helix transcriptional regulator [Gemmataceae bacterium]
MSDLPHFAGCLRRLRADAKLTQHELAKRSGVHRQSIARIELGGMAPSWQLVQQLARALGVSVTAFVDPEIIPSVVEQPRRRGRPRLDAAPANPPPPKKPRKRKRTEG